MTQPNEAATLQDRIDLDLRQAMRDRDVNKKLTLRSLKTALTEAEKANNNQPLEQDEAMKVVAKAAKQRRDAIDEYQKAGRTELAEQEEAELAVLESYLPQQMSEAEVEAIVRAAIAETGADSTSDLGKVMPLAMKRTGGKADGRVVNQIARRLLG